MKVFRLPKAHMGSQIRFPSRDYLVRPKYENNVVDFHNPCGETRSSARGPGPLRDPGPRAVSHLLLIIVRL